MVKFSLPVFLSFDRSNYSFEYLNMDFKYTKLNIDHAYGIIQKLVKVN